MMPHVQFFKYMRSMSIRFAVNGDKKIKKNFSEDLNKDAMLKKLKKHFVNIFP
jgi:hypothetical protein